MKNLKPILLTLACVLGVSLLIAAVSNPQKIGLFVSSDGSGNPGTWAAVSGSGTPYTGSVQPTGMFVSTDGSGNPGTWVAATSATFASQTVPGYLQYTGDGSEGAISCPSGTCFIYANAGERWLSSLSISAGATLATNNTANGPYFYRVSGACNIQGTLSTSPNSGGTGGSNPTNFGSGGGGGGGGTGAGGAGIPPTLGGAGGTAGTAGGGAGGAGGQLAIGIMHEYASGIPWISNVMSNASGPQLFNGGPGGAGGTGGPAGGLGGMDFTLVCGSLNFTGIIDVGGGNGANSTANNMGASGGGGGGILILRSPKIVANTGTIKTAGGLGGTCGAFTGCGAGGAGGNGWALVFTQ